MKRRITKGYTDTLAGLTTFGIFAVCVILCLLAGVGAYQRLVSRDTETYDARICAQYIRNKVRSAQSAESVCPESDGSVLRIREELEGEIYVSRIYLRDGWICELYTAENAEADPEAGQRLLEAEALEFSLEDGFFTAAIRTAGGAEQKVCLSLSGEEGGDGT